MLLNYHLDAVLFKFAKLLNHNCIQLILIGLDPVKTLSWAFLLIQALLLF